MEDRFHEGMSCITQINLLYAILRSYQMMHNASYM